MSRLRVLTEDLAQKTVEDLYKDIERRITASQPGLCPVNLTMSFVHLSRAQSCGKCVPCRIGLVRIEEMLRKVLEGEGSMRMLEDIEHNAEAIYYSADCAIGFEAAHMVLKGIKGFRDDYIEHIEHGRCLMTQNQSVPCVSRCPAGVDIPGYISLVREGRYSDAVHLIRKDNPLPSVCALICEKPCEARCRRTLVDDPVNIRGLKRYAVDHDYSDEAPVCAPSTGKHVSVIGGGPGGLSAAYYLAKMGHDVTIYEQRKKLGGMLRYGIPNYRLPRTTLDKEIKHILSAGIHVETEVSIGKDISIEELQRNSDAIYMSIGAQVGKKVGIEGEDAEGVVSAVDLLRAIGDDEIPDYEGLDVVVIGGGNVAMDVARSAIRLGANTVKIVYRRRKSDMTALEEEVEGAIADGCEIVELHAPIRIEHDEDNKVSALWVKPEIVGEVVNGRPMPRDSKQDEIRIPCDLVLEAVGQGIDLATFVEEDVVTVQRGSIQAFDTGNVKSEGIFAGGDCVTGPATCIRAVAAGKVAAANIDEYLGFAHIIENDIELPPVKLSDFKSCGRVNMKERSASERVCDFDLMEIGLTEEEAMQEASRCLHCDHFGYGIFKGGRVDRW